MMRTGYDEELRTLAEATARMGALCEEAIAAACKSLFSGDERLRRAAFDADEQVDRMERDIEQRCLRLLLRQQPVAADLRFLSSALKLISDLERIGDQASDIAALGLRLGPVGEEAGWLGEMARAAVCMVSDAVRAYAARDLALARAVVAADDGLDALFSDGRAELAARIGSHPADSARLLDLLMAAKYLERIGDHATNVAEWAEYAVTGLHPKAAERRAGEQPQ